MKIVSFDVGVKNLSFCIIDEKEKIIILVLPYSPHFFPHPLFLSHDDKKSVNK